MRRGKRLALENEVRAELARLIAAYGDEQSQFEIHVQKLRDELAHINSLNLGKQIIHTVFIDQNLELQSRVRESFWGVVNPTRCVKNLTFGCKKHRSYKGWEFQLSMVGFLLPKDSREEWIGDFRESLEEMRAKGLPRWILCAVAIGRIALLLMAGCKIRIADLLPAAKKRRM